jgi:hypothetical protein
MSSKAPGNKLRLAFTRYAQPILLLSGMSILFFLILDHFLHNGMTLSRSEKYLYITLSAGAVFLLIAGLWAGTSTGRLWINKLFRNPENDRIELSQGGQNRFLGWLILLTAYAIVFVAYLDIKYSVIHLDAARTFTDTSGYIQSASYALTDIRFWSARRAFTVPLFYKISGYTLSNFSQQDMMERISRYQSLFSVFCWGILAVSFSLVMKRSISKIIAFAIIIFLGACLSVTQWDRSMLAESISTSCMVLLIGFLIIAGLLWNRHSPLAGWKVAILSVLILLSGILFAFSRDANTFWLLAFSGLMFIGIFFPSTRMHPLFRAYMIIMVGFIVIFSLQNLTVNRSRYVNSLFGVVVYRVIPQQNILRFFIAHGMPYKESFNSLTSLNLKQLTVDAMSEKSVQQLYVWVGDHGMSVLARYLLSHPTYTLSAPFMDIQGWVNSENNAYRKILVPASSRIYLLSKIMYLQWDWSPVVFLLLFFVCVGMVWFGRQRESLWLFVLSLFISAYPLALLIWHSDPGELQRHAFQVALQLRLASWMLIVILFDRVLVHFQDRKKAGKQLK